MVCVHAGGVLVKISYEKECTFKKVACVFVHVCQLMISYNYRLQVSQRTGQPFVMPSNSPQNAATPVHNAGSSGTPLHNSAGSTVVAVVVVVGADCPQVSQRTGQPNLIISISLSPLQNVSTPVHRPTSSRSPLHNFSVVVVVVEDVVIVVVDIVVVVELAVDVVVVVVVVVTPHKPHMATQDF